MGRLTTDGLASHDEYMKAQASYVRALEAALVGGIVLVVGRDVIAALFGRVPVVTDPAGAAALFVLAYWVVVLIAGAVGVVRLAVPSMRTR